MLNILEAYDIAGLGFGSADNVHLLAEVLKIAFADRAVATADPDFVAGSGGRATPKNYTQNPPKPPPPPSGANPTPRPATAGTGQNTPLTGGRNNSNQG